MLQSFYKDYLYNRVREMQKKFNNSIFIIILGVIFGSFSKYCDGSHYEFLYKFGLFTSALTLWLIIFTIFIYLGNTKRHSLKITGSFMIPMFISYYGYSYYFSEYLSIKMVYFWIAMLLISMMLLNKVWNIRYTKKFKYLFVVASLLCLSYDFMFIIGAQFIIFIPQVILVLIVYFYINKVQR